VIYGYKIDIWALGIILFELIFGFNPFDAEDIATLTVKQMAGPKFPPGAPDFIVSLISGMLQVNKDHRSTLQEIQASPFIAPLSNADVIGLLRKNAVMAQDLCELSMYYENTDEPFLSFSTNEFANMIFDEIRTEARSRGLE
jgi:serine/threonine protein kinase